MTDIVPVLFFVCSVFLTRAIKGYLKDSSWRNQAPEQNLPGLKDCFLIVLVYSAMNVALINFLPELRNLIVILSVVMFTQVVSLAVAWYLLRKREYLLGEGSEDLVDVVISSVRNFVAIIPLLAIVSVIWNLILINAGVEVFEKLQPVGAMLLKNKSNPGVVVLSLVVIVILAPLSEEFIFRGIFFRYLRGYMGWLPAAILVSLLFAAVHFDIIRFAPLFVLGMVLAGLREKTGKLTHSIALHAVNNLAVMAIILAK